MLGNKPSPSVLARSGSSLILFSRKYPAAIKPPATGRICKIGIPGISISTPIAIPVIIMERGCCVNCLETSSFKEPSDTARVTIIPVETEISKDGICPTRPSPTVAIE